MQASFAGSSHGVGQRQLPDQAAGDRWKREGTPNPDIAYDTNDEKETKIHKRQQRLQLGKLVKEDRKLSPSDFLSFDQSKLYKEYRSGIRNPEFKSIYSTDRHMAASRIYVKASARYKNSVRSSSKRNFLSKKNPPEFKISAEEVRIKNSFRKDLVNSRPSLATSHQRNVIFKAISNQPRPHRTNSAECSFQPEIAQEPESIRKFKLLFSEKVEQLKSGKIESFHLKDCLQGIDSEQHEFNLSYLLKTGNRRTHERYHIALYGDPRESDDES